MAIAILCTIYYYFMLVSMVLVSFVVCLFARIFVGHIAAKRCHEAILGRFLFVLLRPIGIPSVQIVGNIPPPPERFVIVANHSSWMDHAAMSFVVPCDKKYLTNAKYYHLPFFGWTQWLVKDIGVDLSSPAGRKQSVVDCEETLKKGIASIVVYPEGTREYDPPNLREFKKGAFVIAQNAKVRMLPVALVDVWKVLNRKGMAGPAKVQVVIGEPFYVKEGEAGVNEAIADVRAWLEKQLRVV